MPYSSISELPEDVKKLPKDKQKVWRDVFNSSMKRYRGDEKRCFATAWSAVKNIKKYVNDEISQILKKSENELSNKPNELSNKPNELLNELNELTQEEKNKYDAEKVRDMISEKYSKVTNYEYAVEQSKTNLLKQYFKNCVDETKKKIGELQAMLLELDPSMGDKVKEGKDEYEELNNKVRTILDEIFSQAKQENK